MSGDFREQDHRGLADWLNDCAVPDQRDDPDQRAVPDQGDDPGRRDDPARRGGPAYVVSFGWIPSRLPPAPASAPLIPTPRRALDDQR